MVSEKELVNVLKNSLQEEGQYGRLKADLYTQLIKALGLDKQISDPDKPQPPLSIALVNELVREYLTWSGFKFTEQIFSAEASVQSNPMTREEICQKLNVKEVDTKNNLPLLLNILSTLKKE